MGGMNLLCKVPSFGMERHLSVGYTLFVVVGVHLNESTILIQT
jgi:hypothetical protein